MGQLPVHALRRIDCHELKILCDLLVVADELGKRLEQDATDLKSARMLVQVAAQIHRFSAVFGLNPADRKRLAIADESPPEEDPYAALLARRAEARNGN